MSSKLQYEETWCSKQSLMGHTGMRLEDQKAKDGKSGKRGLQSQMAEGTQSQTGHEGISVVIG